MKKLIIAVLFSLLLAGCVTKHIAIPDEPRYRDIRVYQLEQGILFDQRATDALRFNIQAMKEYAEKLRKLLEDSRKE